MTTVLYRTCPLRPSRTLAHPVGEAMLCVVGSGRHETIRYVTNDGWIGVCLDGETRVDEYPLEYVRCSEGRA